MLCERKPTPALYWVPRRPTNLSTSIAGGGLISDFVVLVADRPWTVVLRRGFGGAGTKTDTTEGGNGAIPRHTNQLNPTQCPAGGVVTQRTGHRMLYAGKYPVGSAGGSEGVPCDAPV